jgi:hypothetical protein
VSSLSPAQLKLLQSSIHQLKGSQQVNKLSLSGSIEKQVTGQRKPGTAGEVELVTLVHLLNLTRSC